MLSTKSTTGFASSHLRISAVSLIIFVAAPFFLESQAFQSARTGVGSWPVSTGKLQRQNVQNGIQFFNSKVQRTIVLHESATESEEVASEEKKDDEEGIEAPKESRTTAATNTINERLMAELKEAEETERFGKKGKKMSLVDGYGRPRKTDAERQAAIEAARDLNGVNPVVAIVGSFFAFAVAAALWVGTNKLGAFFAAHPPETEVYFVQRTSQVFRNVVMGMVSLASGFFGVTGLGIFGMGVRVAYGVMTRELDPTPIKSRSAPTKETVDLGNMMDLMMNKKPGRRGGGKRN